MDLTFKNNEKGDSDLNLKGSHESNSNLLRKSNSIETSQDPLVAVKKQKCLKILNCHPLWQINIDIFQIFTNM